MSEMFDRIVGVVVGPGAMCRMPLDEAEDVARDILAAMREPTEAMLHAAVSVYPEHGGTMCETCAREYWQAMIDANLSPLSRRP